MDDILALQRELAAVQEESTTRRLSERNCIEILMKVVKLGLLDLIYTCNGKEFLTPRQLRLELHDELLAAGGRLALSDVQPLLNVDIVYIEKAAADLVQEDPTLLLLNGELISSWHLEGVVDEVLTQVLPNGEGKLAVANLAAQVFNLPVPVTEKAIKERLEQHHTGQGAAKLKHGVLYTDAYEKTQAARIRGVLTGATRPVSLSELVGLYSFDEAVLDEVVPKLIKDGDIVGTLRGREYVPTAFSRTQRDCIDAFFAQNQYLEFSRAHKLQVYRPLEYVRQSFPDALLLGKKMVVSASLLKDLDANIEEMTAHRSWLDVLTVLPPVLSSEEAAALVTESPCVGRGTDKPALALGGTYVVSKAFLQDALKYFGEPAVARAVELSTKRKGSGAMESATGEEGESTTILTNSSSSSSKSRKATKKSSSSSAKRGDVAGSSSSSSSDTSFLLGDIEAGLVAWQPTLEDCPDLVEALAEELQGDIVRMVETAVAASQLSSLQQSGGAATRRKEQKVFEEQLEAASTILQLVARGLSAVIFASEDDKKEMLAFLLRSRGAQVADIVSARATKLHDVTYVVAGTTTQPSITLEQRNILKQDLPKPLGEAVVRLWTLAVKGKASLEELLECLETQVAPALDALYRKLDKKKEKALVFARRMELLTQLARSESPTEMLLVGYQLCLLQGKGAVLFAAQSDADVALASSSWQVVDVLSRAVRKGVEGEEGGGGGGLKKVQELERVYKEYEGCAGDAERRSELAQSLLAAQAGVKESFAKKGTEGGGGGGV